MKILFTKTSIEKEVSEKLGADFICGFQDFIKINLKKADEFNTEFYTLLFTSKNGVLGFLENGFTFRKNQKIITVGSKTKTIIEEKGGLVFQNFKNIEEFSIEQKDATDKICHFCGNLALEPKEISDNYKKIEIYKTELLYPKISEKYDAVVFFSPSGVRSFAKFNSLENFKIFSIGQTTEKELKKFTQNRIFSSEESNLEDLLNIIKQQAES